MSPDPTTVMRVFNETTQRVKGSHLLLNTAASFVVIADRLGRTSVCHGSKSSTADRKYAEDIGKDMAREMPHGNRKVNILVEGAESKKSLDEFLDLL